MRKGWVAAAALTALVLNGWMVQAGATPQASPLVTKSQLQAVVDEEGVIPNEAIRLRIIANSDSEEDQALKRLIRDRIIAAVGEELRGIEEEEAAKAKMEELVPQMNEIAAQVIAEQGFTYSVETDFGLVPFPTKLYGDKVYPAGDYEALRIRIGEAQGQNWWCVLFPPLCFVDMANGDAVQAKNMEETKPATEPIATLDVESADGKETTEVQVRSALFDKIGSFFSNLFA